MRHRIFGRQLNRTRNQRQALFRSLLRSLFTHGFITTTSAKAKSIVAQAEKIASQLAKADLNSLRSVNKVFDNRVFVSEASAKIKAAFAEQKSNFFKMEKVGVRQGDDALMVKLSLVKAYLAPVAPAIVEKKAPAKSVKKVAEAKKVTKKTVTKKVVKKKETK